MDLAVGGNQMVNVSNPMICTENENFSFRGIPRFFRNSRVDEEAVTFARDRDVARRIVSSIRTQSWCCRDRSPNCGGSRRWQKRVRRRRDGDSTHLV